MSAEACGKSAINDIIEPNTLDTELSPHSNVITWYIAFVIINIYLPLKMRLLLGLWVYQLLSFQFLHQQPCISIDIVYSPPPTIESLKNKISIFHYRNYVAHSIMAFYIKEKQYNLIKDRPSMNVRPSIMIKNRD